MGGIRRSGARRAVSWAAFALGAVWAVIGVIDAVTADPRAGAGWGGGVTLVVLVAGPMLVLGALLRSSNPAVLRWVTVGAAVLAVLVVFVLVMQLLDPIEPEGRALLTQVPPAAVYVAGVVVTLPAWRHR